MMQYPVNSLANESTSHSLIEAARGGNREAWATIADIYSGSIYEICRRRGLQPHDAAEIVQLSLVRVFRWMQNGSTENLSFRGLLNSIAHNLTVDHFRSSARRPRTNEAIEVVEVAGSAEELGREIENELLRQALPAAENKFRPKTFQIAMEVIAVGRSIDLVAQRFEVSKGTVSSYVSRVLATLREIIGEI